MSGPLISMNHRRLSAGTYPNYANEGDPSWEDVVNMVVIPGNDTGIYEAAGQWDLLLTRVRQVQTAIDELKTGLESWEGAAGDTYRNHLTQLSTAITMIDSSSRMPDTLRTAGDHVANTLNNTPIPGELVGEVRDAREQFLSGGALDTRFHDGFFFDTLLPSFLGPASNILSAGLGFLDALPGMGAIRDKASDMVRDFLSSEDDKAIAAYRSLSGSHRQSRDGQRGGYGDRGARGHQPRVRRAGGSTARPAAGPGTGTMPSIAAPGADRPSVPTSGRRTRPGSVPGSRARAGAAPCPWVHRHRPGGSAACGWRGRPRRRRSGRWRRRPAELRVGRCGPAGRRGRHGWHADDGRCRRCRDVGPAGHPGGRHRPGRARCRWGRAEAGARRHGRHAHDGRRGRWAGRCPRRCGRCRQGRSAGSRESCRRWAGPEHRPWWDGWQAPMAGAGAGAGGGDGTDHSTWLNEDEDVWGVDSDAPPPVVG